MDGCNSHLFLMAIAKARTASRMGVSTSQFHARLVREHLSLADCKTLHFDRPDEETFRCLALCRAAIQRGGTAPAIANGANEAANDLFRAGRLRFLQIAELVEAALANVPFGEAKTLGDVLAADAAARAYVKAHA